MLKKIEMRFVQHDNHKFWFDFVEIVMQWSNWFNSIWIQHVKFIDHECYVIETISNFIFDVF